MAGSYERECVTVFSVCRTEFSFDVDAARSTLMFHRGTVLLCFFHIFLSFPLTYSYSSLYLPFPYLPSLFFFVSYHPQHILSTFFLDIFTSVYPYLVIFILSIVSTVFRLFRLAFSCKVPFHSSLRVFCYCPLAASPSLPLPAICYSF